MANLPVKDGAGNSVYLKATGTGSNGDPYIPEQATTVSGTVTANLGTIGGAATAANQTTLIGHVDSLETLVAAVATQATLSAIQTLLGAGLPAALVGGRLSVDGSGVTQPVSAAGLPLPSGAATEATLAAIQTLVDALTTPADTQPISAASLPLPTGAATQTTLASVLSALQAALTVTATNLDIRDLSSASDSVAVTDGGGSLTVDGPLTDAELRATAVSVSAASLPLPSGAATAANQATLIGHVDGVETLLGAGLPSALVSDRLKVDGSGVTQPVSAASLPLPTGAATEATLLDIQTAVEGTLAVSGTVTANLAAGDNNIGNVDVVTLPALPAGTNNIGDVDIASLPNEGQQSMANSISVAIASDQSAVPVSGTITASGDVGLTRGGKTLSDPAPTTTATLLLAANADRLTAILHNNGAQTVYLGAADTVTASTGLPLLPGATLVDDRSDDAWYGITASGTGDIRVVEVE